MKFHIVRNGETTKDILNIYGLQINELKEANRHVRDFNKLLAGTKLKIPIVNEAINQDINDMEPFIEEYYPKYDDEFQEKEIVEDVVSEMLEENIINDINNDNIKEENKNIDKDINVENKNIDVDNNKVDDRKIKNESKANINNNVIPNISYVYYQPYPYFYPVYIKVK